MAGMEDLFSGPSTRLKDPVSLQDLVLKKQIEFTIDSNQDFPDLDESERERSASRLYDYEDLKQVIDLDCINLEGEGDNTTPFETLRSKMSPLTEDKLIYKMILRNGSGDIIPENAMVYSHYNMYFEHVEEPFDSSYLRSTRPERFQLGLGKMFPGFEICLKSMKIGEKSKFLVGSEYGFGPLGVPPRIPPAATILIHIEIIKVVDCGTEEDPLELSEMEPDSFEDLYKRAHKFHRKGNDLYEKKDINNAIKAYKDAEAVLLRCRMNNDDEETKFSKLHFKILNNLCICYNNKSLACPEKVCTSAQEAKHYYPKMFAASAKIQYNLASAKLVLGSYDEAKKLAASALRLEPTSTEISELLKKIENKKKVSIEYEKSMYSRALGFQPARQPESSEELSEMDKATEEALREFATSQQSRLDIPVSQLTTREIAFCKKVCSTLDLRFNDKTICGRRSIYITK